MKILMLAPEPFFQPRGTPISIYFRLKTLSDLNHKVDLITYHLGENQEFPGMDILRIPNILGIKKIKIGPSLTKIPLDFLLFVKAAWRVLTRKYDLIFSHEEAAFMGILLGKVFGIPHLYDMHSSLPQQLINFNFTRSKVLVELFKMMERSVLKNSRSILVICPDLQRIVAEQGYGYKSILLENFLDFSSSEISEKNTSPSRDELAPNGEKIVVYTGNFQTYQGVHLLLEAASAMKNDPVKFVLVGDTPQGITRMKQKAEKLNITDKFHFIGQIPPQRVPIYISLADALVSPRISGTNTPLKIYSFLKSGKPVVATRLWTHTQVLNDDLSILVRPDAENLADGIRRALFSEEGKNKGKAAKEFASKEYSYIKYREKLGFALSKSVKQNSQKEAR